MTVGIIGGGGNIGRRYQAVLRYLKIPYRIYEVGAALPQSRSEVDRLIIATPTSTHFLMAHYFAEKQIPFLLEKPATKSLLEATILSELDCPGYMVNNYAFLNDSTWWPQKLKTITYDFFHSGSDGLKWDICQLIWIAKMSKASLLAQKELPFWTVTFNNIYVEYQEIERSYLKMVKAFCQDEWHKLWPLRMALPMTEAILEVDDKEPGYLRHDFA